MPKIDVSHKDLCNLIGRKLSAEQLGDEVLFAKAELDEINGDMLKIDVKDTNRPDLWSAEGVAREIRAKYKPGIPKYDVRKSPFVVNVEKSVESVRPYTACAVVKGLKINDTVMSQLLQLQEKVAGTFGRNRKEVAIGVYDLGRIKFPITYKSISPEGIKFIPLDFKEKMTPKEILERHPKGKEFGHLLNGKSMYPLFIDSEGEVLSVPPIINSDHSGKVTEKTTDVFIECSGFDKRFLYTALNVLVSALQERGGIIYGVKVVYDKKSEVTPDLAPKKFRVSVNYINKVSGLQLPVKD
ncbi:MAG: phenylalanine--tRNA ligase subunit beta, partial [Candidatus Aenigmatarchaeota archaeon]